MRHRGFDTAQRHPVARALVEAIGQLHVDEGGAGLLQRIDGAVEGALRILVEAVHVGGEADALAAHARPDRRGIVRHRQADRRGIFGIFTGDDAEDDRSIESTAGHRADMVERPASGKTPARLDPSPGGLQSRQAVHGRGKADRAAGVGAQRGEAEAGCSGRARSPTRMSPSSRRRSTD